MQVGRALGVRIERRRTDASGELRFTRGVVAVNEPANLPERGLLVIATLPRLDVDAWSNLLAPDTPPARGARPAAAGDDLHIDLVALRTDELVVQGHTVRNLTLGATRQDDGGYCGQRRVGRRDGLHRVAPGQPIRRRWGRSRRACRGW